MIKNICTMCGKEYESEEYGTYTCAECEEKINLIKKMEMVDKARKLLEKKIGKSRILKQKIDVSKFSELVKDRAIKGIDKFSSIPEAAVAIQMEKIGLEYETQKEVAGKRVDFYIPELKIILEIDGELYHTDGNKSFLRDREIMREVGEEWEIVHIEASKVPKYTWDLKEALMYVVSERNDKWRFRDSLFDTDLLIEFHNLELYMKKGGSYGFK